MSRQKKQKEEEAVVEAVEEEECGPIPITKLEVRLHAVRELNCQI
jgi:hypothetical protein